MLKKVFTKKKKSRSQSYRNFFSSVSQYFKIIDTMFKFCFFFNKKKRKEFQKLLVVFGSFCFLVWFVEVFLLNVCQNQQQKFWSTFIYHNYAFNVFSLAHYKSDCLLNNLCKKLLVSLFFVANF